MDFDGTDDIVLMEDYTGSGTEVTVEAWVYADTLQQWGIIAANWSDAIGEFHFGLDNNTQKLSAYIGESNGGYEKVVAPNVFPTGEWKHVAFVADATDKKVYLYIDGSVVADISYDGTLKDTFRDLGIGAKPNTTDTGGVYTWDGRIDEVRIWSDARTQAEIQDNMNNVLVGNEAGLAAYYQMNTSNTGNSHLEDDGSASADIDGVLTNMGSANWAATVAFDTTAPIAPSVSGTTPTNDTTPTWSWTAGGGGNGNYRYKLDDSDLTSEATATISTSYTPGSALSEGAHTLYVQEWDGAGNWSSSGSKTIVVDTTAPTNQNTVFASAASASGGDTVTIVSSGDSTNNVWFAPSGTTSFTAGSTMTKAVNGVATSILAPATDGTYYLYILDTAGGISSASTAALTVTSSLSTPLGKTDVVASVKAMSTLAVDSVGLNFNAVEHRVAWLNSNVGRTNLSHQGIRLNFANPTVDKLMNTAYVKPGKFDPTNEFLKLLRNNIDDGDAPEIMAMTDDTKQGLTNLAYNEFAKVREDTLDKVLNATGGSVMGDWNMWTEGRITVGKTKATTTSSAQDSKTQNISLGFDRIVKEDNHPELDGHIIGVVLGIGKSDADTINNSTVDADSYSLSAYGVIRQDDKALAQAMMGYGRINVDKKRIDGSDTLTGSHAANQFFTSLKAQKEAMSVGNFSMSPYGKIHASRTWYDGYSETGGNTALTYGEQTIDSTVLSVGVDADYMIPINKGNIRPFMQFEYGADVSGSSTVNMHYNNEITNYQLELDNKADSNWKFVVGADMYTKDEWDSSISYERTEAVNAGYSDALAVKVGLRF